VSARPIIWLPCCEARRPRGARRDRMPVDWRHGGSARLGRRRLHCGARRPRRAGRARPPAL